jgi:hypothetical protein
MSPEQAAGELDIDGRSDLYSVGVLGHYMLTGTLPFDGASFESLAAKHIAEEPAPLADAAPDAPVALRTAIERCMLKARDLRFRTGRELADALATAPVRRRWFGKRTNVAHTALLRTRIVAELAMVSAALKAIFKWTAM